MISCGEASGDLYAGALTAELQALQPDAEIFGFGGHRLKAAGGHLIGDFSGLSVTGLTEAIRVVPRSFAMLRRLIDEARELRPHVFVAIDSPDFNFRLLAALRRLGIPIVYYVSPQLWAWRPGRMETMKTYVDRVLVIFPFEEALYREAGVDVQFVGHPLVDLAKAGEPRETFLHDRGLVPDAPTVALLPGSRKNELDRTVPIMAAAIPLIRAQVPNVQFVVACAPNMADALFAPLVDDDLDAGVVLVRDRTDDVLAASDVVITASGTATIQSTLHREADGRRVSAVAADLSPGQAVRPRGHVRDAQPRRWRAHRARADSVGFHRRTDCRRSAEVSDRPRPLRAHARGAHARPRAAWGAGCQRARGPGGPRSGSRFDVCIKGTQ